MRRMFLWVGIALLAGSLGVFWFAPQFVPLMREGFPAEVWPARGEFSQVAGNVNASAEGAERTLPAAALSRFSESGGRALLVDRGGEIASVYGPGIDAETRLNSFSMVKSLVGALVLRAHTDGILPNLDAQISEYLGPESPGVTLRQALSMTSGLVIDGEPAKSVDDAGFSPFGPLARLHMLGLPHILPTLETNAAAQGRFSYQSMNTAVLGVVLEQAYDQPLQTILSDQIWRPAGAYPAEWRTNPSTGRVSAYCCLYARAVDWVAVGRYLLNNGTPDAPFLPEATWRAWLLPDLDPQTRRAGPMVGISDMMFWIAKVRPSRGRLRISWVTEARCFTSCLSKTWSWCGLVSDHSFCTQHSMRC